MWSMTVPPTILWPRHAKLGVDYIVQHTCNKGLARAFRTGLDACLQLGADIIVNTDADNQYAGADIPKLIQPILEEKADIVVGDRQVGRIEHFSMAKTMLQKVGSSVVRRLSETDIPDSVSGFRALSREAASADQYRVVVFLHDRDAHPGRAEAACRHVGAGRCQRDDP